MLAPAAYQCNICGYEGGDGWAIYKQAKREALFKQMSPAERRESAKQDLLEARTLLLSGIVDIERAKSLSYLDVVGLTLESQLNGDGEGHEKRQALTAGIGLLLEAKQRAMDAQAKLDMSLRTAATAEGGGMSYETAAFDLHMDSVFTDLLAHGDIERTLVEARDMQKAVDKALQEQFML